MRIGWFSPVSAQTGISTYTQNVLEELRALYPPSDVDVTVYHPPTAERTLRMPYPTIELGPTLLRSDFHALFDVPIYHLGNNEKNHKEIYEALLAHPGVVVLHDYVYQHYLAGKTVRDGFVGPNYGNLIFDQGGADAFKFLCAGQVLRCDEGQVLYVPWESDWSVQVPFCDLFARLGAGAIVHSDYARNGLGQDYSGTVTQLFMPRPDIPAHLDKPISVPTGRPIHLVFCGHIGSTKGLSLLSAAFQRDSRLREAFRVTIAGFASDADFLAEFQEGLRNSNLQAVFDLRIGLAAKDFHAVLASADVFFNLRFPNTEGASLSLAEQLAYGRPIIAYPTGCFAEIPAEAAYFLTRIGDEAELADLLLRIDRERDDLPARGAAARAAVQDQTAGSYAAGLVEALRDAQPVLERRIQIATARRDERPITTMTAEERAWADDFVTSRRRTTALFDGKPHLPDTFFDANADDKGRLLALNLLCSRIPDQNCLKIGKLIDDLDILAAHDLVGRLLILSTGALGQEPLVPSYLNSLFLPDFDPLLWEILSLLAPMQAVPMALAAMNLPTEDTYEWVLEAESRGFRQVLLRIIREESAFDLESEALEPVRALLTRVDVSHIEDLPTVDRDTELLEDMRKDDLFTIRSGFHPVETIGIWTQQTRAALYFLAPNDTAPRTVSGVASLFGKAITKDAEVQFSLTEELTGKRWERAVCYKRDAKGKTDANVGWTIETPSLSGPIRLEICVDQVHIPEELSSEFADKRSLGVLLQSLRVA